MGQYAEDIIDHYCDSSGDYTAEYNAPRQRFRHFKLTPAERNINAVRKELAILIKQRIKDNTPNAVGGARQLINLKYGKGWRECGLGINSDDQWKPLNQYPL